MMVEISDLVVFAWQGLGLFHVGYFAMIEMR
jgi:hypothetical protein